LSTQKSFRTPQKIYAKNPENSEKIQKIQIILTKKSPKSRKTGKIRFCLQKSPNKVKKSKNLEKIQKIPENPEFFPFLDLNLRTPKCRVVNPSGKSRVFQGFPSKNSMNLK